MMLGHSEFDAGQYRACRSCCVKAVCRHSEVVGNGDRAVAGTIDLKLVRVLHGISISFGKLCKCTEDILRSRPAEVQ